MVKSPTEVMFKSAMIIAVMKSCCSTLKRRVRIHLMMLIVICLLLILLDA